MHRPPQIGKPNSLPPPKELTPNVQIYQNSLDEALPTMQSQPFKFLVS